MYRKDQLDKLMNHFQEYINFSSNNLEELLYAIEHNDLEIANKIINVNEPRANEYESQIEEQAIRFLALNQAEASILRTIVMVIKMNNDLERICDNISNISGSLTRLISDEYSNQQLSDMVTKMLTKSLNMLKDVNFAFLQRDVKLCKTIIKNDDEIDAMHSLLYKATINEIINNPDLAKSVLRYNRMSKNIERACDLMTNIAEDIIFLVTGQDVKHNS